jgi:hypothetical protein
LQTAAGNGAPYAPRLRGEFVKAFVREEGAGIVFRIRIWVEGVPSELDVLYELHPEAKNGPVPRPALGRNHEQWLNTARDYALRLRTSDRREWTGYGVLKALHERYDEGHSSRIVLATDSAGQPSEYSVERAIQILEAQTEAARAAPDAGGAATGQTRRGKT